MLPPWLRCGRPRCQYIVYGVLLFLFIESLEFWFKSSRMYRVSNIREKNSLKYHGMNFQSVVPHSPSLGEKVPIVEGNEKQEPDYTDHLTDQISKEDSSETTSSEATTYEADTGAGTTADQQDGTADSSEKESKESSEVSEGETGEVDGSKEGEENYKDIENEELKDGNQEDYNDIENEDSEEENLENYEGDYKDLENEPSETSDTLKEDKTYENEQNAYEAYNDQSEDDQTSLTQTDYGDMEDAKVDNNSDVDNTDIALDVEEDYKDEIPDATNQKSAARTAAEKSSDGTSPLLKDTSTETKTENDLKAESGLTEISDTDIDVINKQEVKVSSPGENEIFVVNEDIARPEYSGGFFHPHDLPPSYRYSGAGAYINLLSEPRIYMHNKYKNPCWREEIIPDDSYKQNYLTQHIITGPWIDKQIQTKIQEYRNRLAMNLPWRLRCLPYFYLAGFVKCGTSEIYMNIRNHPMVAFAKKEIHWWTRYRNRINPFTEDASNIRDYIDLFDVAAIEIQNFTLPSFLHPKIVGDGSTLTISQQWGWWLHPENKDRKLGEDPPRYTNADYIHHVTPNAKIIISMRNPTNRLFSQYTMMSGQGQHGTPDDFHQRVVSAVSEMKKCIQNHGVAACAALPTQTKRDKLALTDSLYYPHIEAWLKVFPREQLHIIKLEDFGKQREQGLNDIFNFLDIEPIASEVLEADSYHIKVGCANCTVEVMRNDTRKLLDDFFQPFNKKLAELLHDDKWLFL